MRPPKPLLENQSMLDRWKKFWDGRKTHLGMTLFGLLMAVTGADLTHNQTLDFLGSNSEKIYAALGVAITTFTGYSARAAIQKTISGLGDTLKVLEDLRREITRLKDQPIEEPNEPKKDSSSDQV